MTEIEAYVVVDQDPRYPILVTRNNNFTLGYWIDPETGKLDPVCLCHARNPSECCCDYDWKRESE